MIASSTATKKRQTLKELALGPPARNSLRSCLSYVEYRIVGSAGTQ